MSSSQPARRSFQPPETIHEMYTSECRQGHTSLPMSLLASSSECGVKSASPTLVDNGGDTGRQTDRTVLQPAPRSDTSDRSAQTRQSAVYFSSVTVHSARYCAPVRQSMRTTDTAGYDVGRPQGTSASSPCCYLLAERGIIV